VGELTRLRFADVVHPSDPRLGAASAHVALRLAVTKTGRNQWVSVQAPDVAWLLCSYLRSKPFAPSDLLFPFPPASFRSLLRTVASSLGVGHLGFVPHSLRHGGATADFLRGRTIEQIMFRGRWESAKSARRYIQSGPALLATSSLPQPLQDLGAVFASGLAPVMSALQARQTGREARAAQAAARRHKRVRFRLDA
jgi:hypothetical protein